MIVCVCVCVRVHVHVLKERGVNYMKDCSL